RPASLHSTDSRMAAYPLTGSRSVSWVSAPQAGGGGSVGRLLQPVRLATLAGTFRPLLVSLLGGFSLFSGRAITQERTAAPRRAAASGMIRSRGAGVAPVTG